MMTMVTLHLHVASKPVDDMADRFINAWNRAENGTGDAESHLTVATIEEAIVVMYGQNPSRVDRILLDIDLGCSGR